MQGGSSGICSRNKALSSCLFIAGCPVELARTKHTRKSWKAQVVIESAWIDIVIFNGIAGNDYFDGAEANDGLQHRQLRFESERRRQAVGINQMRVETLRL